MGKVINNKYEFVLLFDVENGNPNGDPDAGNLPRIDPETGIGIVTDVCLKRKIRNYVDLRKKGETGYNIYVQEGTVLNNTQKFAYESLGLEKGDKKDKENKILARDFMCQNFFDVRTFGAVMTTGDYNCGQVRGPVQINFAKSVHSVIPQEMTITRLAVTNEKDEKKGQTMGRKTYIPYGLYRVEGYIDANRASLENGGTGFTEEDLELVFEALINMFEFDRSASKGKMMAQKLIVFKHDSVFGNAPSHKLFERLSIELKQDVMIPRAIQDFQISVDYEDLPSGVEIIEKL
ncbi:MAG TPA: type I-C CRISPR-associated protein Cas7/Csd2 [Bacillus sp. (in: Bacteria)]|uniref:CRISPR-associated protein Csd2 n=1 Tax=Anoxybacillus andreesenii TaxID=1325932 RepID=A0ABT9V9E5_9BACL|nr:type I-C CRISPR-associated protein Cas7/Csd2 [Robertmurraya andreesenii]MDQ0157557.1 CRISPR-associated protein Csd2 [Robertmurraya andreesenii]HCX48641.1 type I-C CRISPR-associated protein Cas7/Csd2 [Bacillus sp. (in: firmicutes)]